MNTFRRHCILSEPVCDEDVEVMERFTYLGGDIHVSDGCEPGVNLGSLGSHGFTGSWGVALPVTVREDKSSSLPGPWCFQSCSMDVTWTLTRNLRRILNSFGARSLRRILGECWSDFVSNEQLLRKTQRRFVTCVVRER